MSEKDKTDLRDIEDKLIEAFEYAYSEKRYGGHGNSGPLQSIGAIASAIVTVRQQRHIEEGKGDMYQTRYVQQLPFRRSVDKSSK